MHSLLFLGIRDLAWLLKELKRLGYLSNSEEMKAERTTISRLHSLDKTALARTINFAVIAYPNYSRKPSFVLGN